MRAGLSDLFSLPNDWEIVLGNGGSTMFWDVATFGLVADRSITLLLRDANEAPVNTVPVERSLPNDRFQVRCATTSNPSWR